MPFWKIALPLGLGLARTLQYAKPIGPRLPWYIKVGRGYQKFNRKMDSFGPMGYGAMYASGTVLGYQGTSAFFRPKWRYLGSPQRLKKI